MRLWKKSSSERSDSFREPDYDQPAVSPEEIASTMLYLCSDQAQMINGARIPLYGSP